MRTTPAPGQRTDTETTARPSLTHATAVRGTFPSPKGKVGHMSGWLRLDRFVLEEDELRAAGVFTGELIDADGTLIGVGSCRRTVPAEIARSAGGIVATIGPVDVDLLGLVVTVSPFSVEARVPARAQEPARSHGQRATVSPLRRRQETQATQATRRAGR